MIGGYEQLWKAIIRPPRAEYTVQDLGPKVFKRHSIKIERRDIQILNKQGFVLQCSHYEPHNRPCKDLPCVIYLHGNASCRVQGQRIVHYLLSRDITVFTFDFAGCGLSEGPYISLGYYERDDVDFIFKYLRQLGTVSSIGIWGRSMGAVTALMYADKNHQIGCLVLDSPFSNLQKLSKQLAQKHGGGLSIFSGIALSFLKSTIKQKHNFNIEDLDPIGKHVKQAYIPAFFIHGKDDDFIVPKHSQELHKKYGGTDKRIRIVQGDHNTDRPQDVYQDVATFFYYGLCVQDLVRPDQEFMEQNKKEKAALKETKQKEKQEEQEEMEFNFGLEEIDQEEQMLRQAMALSLEQQEKRQSKGNKEQQAGKEGQKDKGKEGKQQIKYEELL